MPNAYTLAISGRKPFIVVHTSLLELLTPAEVQVRHSFPLTSSVVSNANADISAPTSSQILPLLARVSLGT